MGRDGTDTNGHYDFWVDGSGGGNCFEGNDTSTFDPRARPAHPTIAQLYPSCPAPPPPSRTRATERRQPDLQLGSCSPT